MRRILLTTLAHSILLIPHQAATAADEATEKGRAMAERLCAVCHMNPGQGEKAAASGVPSFIAVANRPAQTFEGVQAWLQSVPPMMPNHNLTRDEIHNLAAFIMSLRRRP
jgi:mono/diheme cytochrome c family protein